MYLLSKNKQYLVEMGTLYIKRDKITKKESGLFSSGYVDVTRYIIYAEGKKGLGDSEVPVYIMDVYRYEEEAAKKMEAVADALARGEAIYKF